MSADHCPGCGSKSIFWNLQGWKPSKTGHEHNPNQHRCSTCGKTWYVPCPRCGHVVGPEGQTEPDTLISKGLRERLDRERRSKA